MTNLSCRSMECKVVEHRNMSRSLVKTLEKEEEEEEEEGTAYALGQVLGKLVVTPAWGRIFD
jgi:hypothetical protein